ncbi:hypothetical protein SAMN04515679_0514 [Pelosinus fermentans]|uniref:hypothetical protein n=1 Tax=Pelosinus fermentans TaxID=365349 RepID=UPI000268630E|nr:hypothetical protein [Pelosinus fermentans]OAM92446.1 hypothetical protein FR7_00462 [Pelosinus fermentans DSM 17108]SDQ45180.1 hypothetical protein SAMN04515679_0514 [Pelosinus fermentans]
MNCENVNRWIILGLALALISDVIFLIVEVISQNCDEQEEKKRVEQENRTKDEISELQKEVLALREQLKKQEKLVANLASSVR